MFDADHQMAMVLQKQFDMEVSIERPTNNLVYSDKKKKKHKNEDSTKSLVDPSWELVDPTPNIHVLFMTFNERFFWNKLLAVSVSWSKRMTSCAGVCSYQYRGGLCKITLSEPLLKLRPRKDLVETLLHEMIHALLFVTNSDRDRDGHGPEFRKHMYRINSEAGTNITIYHDFHDEVRLYQQHWWRCNGPCQNRRPYFGFVRRAMNRAPGPNDGWWAEHQYTCGGTFIKVKEPEKPAKKSKENKSEKSKQVKNKNKSDLTKFVSVTKTGDNIKTISDSKVGGGLGIKNKNGTIVLNPKNTNNNLKNRNNNPKNTNNNPKNTNNNPKNINNIKNNSPKINKEITPVISNNKIFTFKDLKNNNNIISKPKTSPNKEVKTSENSSNIDYSVVRNHWLNKFENKISNSEGKRKNNTTDTSISKKSKTDKFTTTVIDDKVNCPNCDKAISNREFNEHLDQCLQDDPNISLELSNEMIPDSDLNTVTCPSCNNPVCEDEVNLHLDECLIKNNENPSTSGNKPITNLTHCEICDKFITSEEYAVHTEQCLNKFYDDIETKYNLNTSNVSTSCLVCSEEILKTDLDTHLDSCMGSAFEGKMNGEEEEDEENEDDGEEDKMKSNEYNCPICFKPILDIDMNKHIDICLVQNKFDFKDFD